MTFFDKIAAIYAYINIAKNTLLAVVGTRVNVQYIHIHI